MHCSLNPATALPRALSIKADAVMAEGMATELDSRSSPSRWATTATWQLHSPPPTASSRSIASPASADHPGLRASGDGYLTQSVASDAMFTRVGVPLRRHVQVSAADSTLRAGDLKLNMMARGTQ